MNTSENKNKLCKFFYEKGNCRKGDQCDFIHDKSIDYRTYQNRNRERKKNSFIH